MITEADFSQVQARIGALWRPHQFNPHMGVLAPTRYGKSSLMRYGILPLAEQERTVVLDVKLGGDRAWDGWGNDTASLDPGFRRGPDGTPRWRVLVQAGEAGRRQVGAVLDVIEQEGACVLVMDDSLKITGGSPGFGYGKRVDSLVTLGASDGVSVIMGGNTTIGMAPSFRNQCGVMWLGPIASARQRSEFANTIGLAADGKHALGRLSNRQFLVSDVRDNGQQLAITAMAA